jgi:DNA-binding transcriptional MerR regulator
MGSVTSSLRSHSRIDRRRVFVERLYSACVATDPGYFRIGEFARRVGVTPELLRAWESRYGLTRPVRTPGGFRLYTVADAARVDRMRRGLDEGLSAAEAARAALQDERPSGHLLEDAAGRLLVAIGRYDEATAHAVLDESFAAFGLELVLTQVVLPTLKQIGDGWERGEIEISQEHFASNLIRGRLLALARFWGRGAGPLALLACAPGEMHDITLLAFALVLRSHTWRVLFLGADTPIATLAQAAETTRPELVVVSSFDPTLLDDEAAGLGRLARLVRLALAGPGATDELCARLGVRRLDGDLVAAADEVTRV